MNLDTINEFEKIICWQITSQLPPKISLNDSFSKSSRKFKSKETISEKFISKLKHLSYTKQNEIISKINDDIYYHISIFEKLKYFSIT